MESAVNQMQRADVPFLFCPNTFNWKQNIQERYKLTDEEKHKFYIDGLTYDFVPEKNLQLYTGIADADYSDIDDINKNGVDGPGDTPIGQNIPILSIGVPQRANTMTGHTGGSYASTMITYDPVRKVEE